MQEKIIIGKTKNRAKISICKNCIAYKTPHFNYYKGKKHYSIEFERPIPIDHSPIMEMNERTDLEIFFASYNEEHQMTNWKLAVKTWNDNNEIQIHKNLHKPYYRNMVEEIDNYTISTWSNRGELPDGMQIYCNEEVEQEPHFHITLTDGADIAIYFYKAEYIQPLSRPLTDEEVKIIVKYLNSRCNIEPFKTNWEYLIFAWNNQNDNRKINNETVMPDYKKLNEEQ